MCVTTKLMDREGVVISNAALTDRLFEMVLQVPDIPADVKGGQFVHVQIPGMEGHMLRRPFSVYYVDLEASTMGILYQVVGFGSKRFAQLLPGEKVRVLGSIGTPWSAPVQTKRALLTVGGVGAAPLYMHACDLVAAGVEVDVVMGAQTKDALVAAERYTRLLGHEPFLATDDGSYGHHGFVTDLVVERLAQGQYDYAACCGPAPMMRIVSQKTLEAGVSSFVSMEQHMACGIGACLGCIVATTEGNRRSCVDGPIFDAAKVVW
ncbi:MAG: dihydroorotate dehydrogenase electron transfer subunit [Coriobacteriia bacterium]|nr:dihydroorotate dehydrogenase electron transfer subunit [Coriobacteriia bacterium]